MVLVVERTGSPFPASEENFREADLHSRTFLSLRAGLVSVTRSCVTVSGSVCSAQLVSSSIGRRWDWARRRRETPQLCAMKIKVSACTDEQWAV